MLRQHVFIIPIHLPWLLITLSIPAPAASATAPSTSAVERCVAAGKNQNGELTIKYCTAALAVKDLSPGDRHIVLFMLGSSYFLKGIPDKAVQQFSELLTHWPSDEDARKIRGDSYRQLHDYDKAINDYNYLLRHSPKSKAALHGRGQAYAEKNSTRELSRITIRR